MTSGDTHDDVTMQHNKGPASAVETTDTTTAVPQEDLEQSNGVAEIESDNDQVADDDGQFDRPTGAAMVGQGLDIVAEVIWLAILALTPYAVSVDGSQAFGLPQSLALRSAVSVLAIVCAVRLLLPRYIPALKPSSNIDEAVSEPYAKTDGETEPLQDNPDDGELADDTQQVTPITESQPVPVAPARPIALPGPAPLPLAAVGGFGLVLILSTVLSPASPLAFWGAHNLNQGLVTWLALLLFVGLVATQLRTRNQLDRLIVVLIWSTVPLLRFALAQTLKGDPIPWVPNSFQVIPYPNGSPLLSGVWAAMIIPLTGYQIIASRAIETRILYIALLILQGAVVILTHTVTSIVGLVCAIVLFGVALAASRGGGRLVAVLGIIPILAAIVALILASVTASRGTPPLQSLAKSVSRSTSWQNRASLTTVAWHAAGQYPILGWGPDIEADALANTATGTETAVTGATRTNSTYLDMLVQTGALGLLAFAVLLGLAVGVVLTRQGRRDGIDQALGAALAASLITFAVVALFCSPDTALWLVVGGLLAAMIAFARVISLPALASESGLSEADAGIGVVGIGQPLLGAVGALVAIVVLWLPIGPLGFFWQGPRYLMADVTAKQAQTADTNGSSQNASTLWQKALDRWSNEPSYYLGKGTTLVEQMTGTSGAINSSIAEQAITAIDKARQLDPINIGALKQEAEAQAQWASAITGTANTAHIETGLALLNKAATLNPHNATIPQEAALLSMSANNFATASSLFAKALDVARRNAPTQIPAIATSMNGQSISGQSIPGLADAAQQAGQPTKAVTQYRVQTLRAFQEGISLHVIDPATQADTLVVLAAQAQDISAALTYGRLYLGTHPTQATQQSATALQALTFAAVQAKQYPLAIQTLNVAEKVFGQDPTSVASIKAEISQIQSLMKKAAPKSKK